MPNPYPETELKLGWNALLDPVKKTALICGEYKVKGKARTGLQILNKATKEEMDAHIAELGYTPIIPVRKSTPPPAQA